MNPETISRILAVDIPADKKVEILAIINSGPVRSKAAERQARYRGKHNENVTRDVTSNVTRDVTSDLFGESEPLKPHKAATKGRASKLADVVDYAATQGVPYTAALDFWDKMEAGGWKRGKEPLKDWQAHLRTMWRSGWLNTTPNKSQTNHPGLYVRKGQC